MMDYKFCTQSAKNVLIMTKVIAGNASKEQVATATPEHLVYALVANYEGSGKWLSERGLGMKDIDAAYQLLVSKWWDGKSEGRCKVVLSSQLQYILSEAKSVAESLGREYVDEQDFTQVLAWYVALKSATCVPGDMVPALLEYWKDTPAFPRRGEYYSTKSGALRYVSELVINSLGLDEIPTLQAAAVVLINKLDRLHREVESSGETRSPSEVADFLGLSREATVDLLNKGEQSLARVQIKRARQLV